MKKMTDTLLMMLQIIAGHCQRPLDVPEYVAYALAEDPYPIPQLTWTLLGLVHYRQRKLWAWSVLRKRVCPLLNRPPKGEGSLQDMLEPSREGIVPGLPDWRYSLDANDTHVINRGTGENIHVDALNGPELIPEGWFMHHFCEHRDPGPAEERLAQLFPGGDGCCIALQVLQKVGLLHPTIDCEFTLCGRVTPYTHAVEHFLDLWQDPAERVWLAALICDWPATHEAALANGDSKLASTTAPRAEQCRRRWQKRLRKQVARAGLDSDLLRALAYAGDEDLPSYLEKGLEDPGTVKTAIELFEEDPTWCKRVYHLLATAETAHLDDHDIAACARYLSRHAYHVPEVLQLLLTQERPNWDALLEVALAHAPEQFVAFLPRALRSRMEYRLTASAILALLDTPWSRGILQELLTSTKSQNRTYEARAALREYRGKEPTDAARQWEQRHPEKRPPVPTDERFLYLFEGGVQKALLNRMAELSDAVRGIQHRLPTR